MRYKTHEIKQQWESGKLNKELTKFLKLIDELAIQTGALKEGIMITSLFRPNDPKYHGKWQACDLRTWDWFGWFRDLTFTVIIQIKQTNPMIPTNLKPAIQTEYEPMIVKKGRIIRGEHLHCEYDDNSLAKDEQ